MMRVGALFSGEEPAYASKCEECGECEEACPQGLPIQDLMKDISGEFEGTGMKVLAWVIKRIMAIQRWGTMRKAKKKK
jgi:predicted aldo/keto reductase-like oxidoreductase